MSLAVAGRVGTRAQSVRDMAATPAVESFVRSIEETVRSIGSVSRVALSKVLSIDESIGSVNKTPVSKVALSKVAVSKVAVSKGALSKGAVSKVPGVFARPFSVDSSMSVARIRVPPVGIPSTGVSFIRFS